MKKVLFCACIMVSGSVQAERSKLSHKILDSLFRVVTSDHPECHPIARQQEVAKAENVKQLLIDSNQNRTNFIWAHSAPTLLSQEPTSTTSAHQPVANYEQDPTSHRCAVATKGMTEKQIEMGLQQDDPWQRVADRAMSKQGANPAPLVAAGLLAVAVCCCASFLFGGDNQQD